MSPNDKKRKRKDEKVVKTTKRPATRNEREDTIDPNIGQMDGTLLADLIAQRTRRFQNKLSAVELEDLHIPAVAFRDTCQWDQQRTTTNLARFLEQVVVGGDHAGQKLRSSAETPGSPHTIVIASSGIRAADIVRALRDYQTKEAKVAKLFAKHIKMDEAVQHLKQTRIGIGVGTPTRIMDLIIAGALQTSSLERIIIDASSIDQKQHTIFDIREIHVSLVQLLNLPGLKPRFTADPLIFCY